MQKRFLLSTLLILGIASTGCQKLQDGSESSTEVLEGSAREGESDSNGAWHHVTTVKGDASKVSGDFTISGREWKISWDSKPQGRDSEFIIILQDKKNSDIAEIIVNEVGATKDYVFLEGKGTYYLRVSTTQPYSIDIQELR